MFGKSYSTKLVSGILTLILLAGWLGFEYFNGQTTYRALQDILGPGSLAAALAMAFVAMDIGGLARVFTPTQEGKQENALIWGLMGAWVLVALANMVLTAWSIEVIIQQRGIIAPASLTGVVQLVPMSLATVVFLLRVLGIYQVGATLDRWIHGGHRVGAPIVKAIKELPTPGFPKARPAAAKSSLQRPVTQMPTSIKKPVLQPAMPVAFGGNHNGLDND